MSGARWILAAMGDAEKSRKAAAPASEEASYPASVESLSEKWRSVRPSAPGVDGRSFLQRHYLAVGIAIALLILSLLTVIGGFAFLVWNAR